MIVCPSHSVRRKSGGAWEFSAHYNIDSPSLTNRPRWLTYVSRIPSLVGSLSAWAYQTPSPRKETSKRVVVQQFSYALRTDLGLDDVCHAPRPTLLRPWLTRTMGERGVESPLFALQTGSAAVRPSFWVAQAPKSRGSSRASVLDNLRPPVKIWPPTGPLGALASMLLSCSSARGGRCLEGADGAYDLPARNLCGLDGYLKLLGNALIGLVASPRPFHTPNVLGVLPVHHSDACTRGGDRGALAGAGAHGLSEGAGRSYAKVWSKGIETFCKAVAAQIRLQTLAVLVPGAVPSTSFNRNKMALGVPL